MSARRQLIAALSEDSYGGIATLEDVAHAEQLVDALVAEVRTEDAQLLAQRGHHLPANILRCAAEAGEKATAAAATATPELTPRQTWLLGHIRFVGGRWKTGRLINLYRTNHLGTVSRDEASEDLAALAGAGWLRQYDEDGVRYYTLNSPKDVRP
jgi:hypothetical protein